MTQSSTLEAAHVEATPAATSEEVVASSIQLDGDEIIQLSIKPSLWFIPVVSLRFVAAAGLLATVVAFATRGAELGALILQVLVILVIVRLALAALQWASRLYVLTNRRAMRFRGVLSVDVSECPLAKISEPELCVAAYQRSLRLGTIRMHPAVPELARVEWEQVAGAAEIHELLVRAIRRSQSGK